MQPDEAPLPPEELSHYSVDPEDRFMGEGEGYEYVPPAPTGFMIGQAKHGAGRDAGKEHAPSKTGRRDR